jgi:hypothetical protein
MLYSAGLVAQIGEVACLHINSPYSLPFIGLMHAIKSVAVSHTDSASSVFSLGIVTLFFYTVQSSLGFVSHSVCMVYRILSLLVKFISY